MRLEDVRQDDAAGTDDESLILPYGGDERGENAAGQRLVNVDGRIAVTVDDEAQLDVQGGPLPASPDGFPVHRVEHRMDVHVLSDADLLHGVHLFKGV